MYEALQYFARPQGRTAKRPANMCMHLSRVNRILRASISVTGFRCTNSKTLCDYISPMAQQASFDVTTGVDLQEVDNAVNQAQKEISQRYDFKGSPATIELDRTEGKIALTAENDYKMEALWDVLQTKLIKRSVPVKNLEPGEIKPATGDTVRRDIALKMALDGDTAKKVAAAIKEAKLKKVQAAIQGDQVRVTSPSRDDLQAAMALLRGKDFGVELKFGNYR
jgi:uncharacterized protein YajQ (UPF0234 family)